MTPITNSSNSGNTTNPYSGNVVAGFDLRHALGESNKTSNRQELLKKPVA